MNHNAIPEPPDATYVGPWVLDDHQARPFNGTERHVRTGIQYTIPVAVRGSQRRDGRVTRHIWVAVGNVVITADEARELARVLVEAADEMDELDGRPDA